MRTWALGGRRVNAKGIPYYPYYWVVRVWDGYHETYKSYEGRAYFVAGKRGQPVMKVLGASLLGAPKGLIKDLGACRKVEKKHLQERTYHDKGRQASAGSTPERCGCGYAPRQGKVDL